MKPDLILQKIMRLNLSSDVVTQRRASRNDTLSITVITSKTGDFGLGPLRTDGHAGVVL
jgi:hypothetical protein